MIEIDGSTKEGGGQILRTALSLSCILQKPVRFTNIRQNRPKPGLQAQHLTCVKALEKICDAKVKGAEIEARVLEFVPGRIKGGDYEFDIGTAGSITLLAQCILPVLLFAEGQSEVQFVGGTHVSFSPTTDYFSTVFLPTVKKMGVDAELIVNRLGWFPVGGGKARLKINPLKEIAPLNLTERKIKEPKIEIDVLYSHLPDVVAQRLANSALAELKEKNVEIKIEKKDASCPGCAVFLKASYSNCVAGFSSLGKKGKPAEEIGTEVSKRFLDFDVADACVNEHLADQLLLYCALAKEKSEFTAEKISQHFETNCWTIGKFLQRKIEVEKSKQNFL